MKLHRLKRPVRKPQGPGLFRLGMLALAIGFAFVALERCGLATLHAAPAEPTTSHSVAATPGSLVRWSGDGIEQCELEALRFTPLDDACYVPVDLGAENELIAHRRRNGAREELHIQIAAYPYPEQHIQLEDTSRVNLSAANEKRAVKEREQIDALWRRSTPRSFHLPLGQPLERPGSPGRFGSRRVFNGEPRSPHTGADYKAAKGTPVLAVADGTVKIATEHFFGGNSVFLDHGDELVTMYFHLDEILVKPGQKVTRGAVIGTVGSTGRATGPHLHFGARWRGDRIDPAALLESKYVEVE